MTMANESSGTWRRVLRRPWTKSVGVTVIPSFVGHANHMGLAEGDNNIN
ncbi:hypothetical protein [Alicyclobacillus sp. SP_1]|nr:hypothetical protein [Alicyclobacillus sp. SP_1]